MDAPAQDTPIFEAVIVPHRSLSPRGRRALALAICLLTCVPAVIVWVLGAWPVVGFCGAEVLLAAGLIALHARRARASEMLLLTESGLRVVRTDPRGRREERTLPAAWLNVVLQERHGAVPRLWLAARGLREEVATSLGEAEKRDLALALRDALHRWRNPVFDNPQLRD